MLIFFILLLFLNGTTKKQRAVANAHTINYPSYVYIIQVIVANGTFQRFAIAVLMHFVAITGIM
ncbi:hypothetical protein BST93_10135 [Nonlabens tegetincola]|nr:hypothetical protein BST93_10135 [Nonlabens tegetincola]